ncbi:MAG: elongation factor Ts [Fibrobacter sp.]|nr:elongation factor Ts [Fibrobacter sp.]
MKITASMVNDLRKKTGVGMMQCKKALTETNGDVDKAVDLLRKQGADVASKRADKAANEGAVALAIENNKAVIVELNCETDFVASSDDFKALQQDAVNALLNNDIDSVEQLLTAKVGDLDIAGRIDEAMSKIGEKMSFKRVGSMQVGEGEIVYPYSHLGGRAGCLVKLSYEGDADTAELESLAKDIAMQLVAFDAVSIDESGVPAEIVEKERAIYREQIELEGRTKPEFIDRQIDGRVRKFLSGICLLEQDFIRDTSVKVKAHLKAEAQRLGLSSLNVTEFIRFELGK